MNGCSKVLTNQAILSSEEVEIIQEIEKDWVHIQPHLDVKSNFKRHIRKQLRR